VARAAVDEGADAMRRPKDAKPERNQGMSYKYGNRKTEIDGHNFDSLAEGRRYEVLRRLERCGDITDLELQPRIDLHVNGVYCGFYRGDFRYKTSRGAVVVEDVKGVKTPIYRLKKKLVRAIHGIRIVEVA
jgi:hypothetical protein